MSREKKSLRSSRSYGPKDKDGFIHHIQHDMPADRGCDLEFLVGGH